MRTRRATLDDAPAIAAAGLEFVGKLKLGVSPPIDRVEQSVRALLADTARGVGLIADTEDGEMAGFLLGMAVPLWFDTLEWAAVELAWWVQPEHRGGRYAMALVKDFEGWAVAQGVRRVVLSDVEFENGAPPAGPFIERLGYSLHERAYVREF